MAKVSKPELAPSIAQRIAQSIVITPARLAEVDEAMWLRAREGDVAAAKVVYARLAETQPVAEVGPTPPPRWEDLVAMFNTLKILQNQKKGTPKNGAGVDDAVELGAGKTG